METRIIECDDLPGKMDVLQVERGGVRYCYVRRGLPAEVRGGLPLLANPKPFASVVT